MMDFVDEFVFCDNDEENEAVVFCVDCEQNLCRDCDDVFHRSKARQSHRRKIINQPNVSDDDSDSCSTNTASSCSHASDEEEEDAAAVKLNFDEGGDAKQEGAKVEMGNLFGGSLEQCMESQQTTHPNLKVPLILHCMIRSIIQKGGLKEEGIFRISVDRNELLKNRNELSQGQYNLPYEASAHVAACLLKMWLRELKEPLIPAKLYNKAIACLTPPVRKGNVLGVWANMDGLRQRVLNQIAGLVQKLSKPENSSSNRMSYKSLAIVFAPSLLRYTGTDPSEAMKNARAEIDFVKVLFEVLPTQHLEYLYQPSGHAADRLLTKTTTITKQTITTMTSEVITTTTTEDISPAKPSVSMPVLRPRSPNVPAKTRRTKTSPSFKLAQPSRPANTAGRHIVKVLIVGNSSCGKTSLIRRYVNDCFDEQYITTVGADYKSKHISWQDGTEVQLQLWDIAGQDRYARMTRPYYQGAEGAVVVCDVSRDVSIEAVKAWKADIDFNLPDIPVILVANKCDLLKDGTAGMVIGGRLQGLSSELKFANWQIISAKKDMNVNEAMNSLVKAVLEKKSKDSNKKKMKREMMVQKGRSGGLRIDGVKQKTKRRMGMKRKSGSSSKKQDSGCVVC